MILEKNEVQNIFDDIHSAVDLDYCQERAKHNFIYLTCLSITQSKIFTFFLSMCIILNTIVLGFDGYPAKVEVSILIEHINMFFILIFVIEMILKMLGIGLKMYFKDAANIFDFIVVAISMVDVVLLVMDSALSKSGTKAL